MRRDFLCTELLVCRGVQLFQEPGDVESVYEERLTALAVVVQEVEDLQSAWIGEVGVVRVCWECEVGVCRIAACEVGREVPEAAVVCCADEADTGAEFFCCLW